MSRNGALPSNPTDYADILSGEDPRFKNSLLLVPDKTLRHRPKDILLPAELAKAHKTYYWRTVIGPSYRADMWSLAIQEPKLSVSELARRTFGYFATAWQVKKDLKSLLP